MIDCERVAVLSGASHLLTHTLVVNAVVECGMID
jgi:hypothetical protein